MASDGILPRHVPQDHEYLRLMTADQLREHLRPSDTIVRFGGDEFRCGLGSADVDDVERRFEAIGGAIRREVGVRISVGFAALARDETLAHLTARADAEMLVDKRSHCT